MKFEKSGLSGSYDEKNDILYIYYKGKDCSYGEEDPEGVVTMRSIETDKVTGFLIYDLRKRTDLDIEKFDLVFRCVISELKTEIG